MLPFIFLFFLLIGVRSDEYLDEIQGRCYLTNQTYSCAKYKLFKYLDDYNLGNVSITSDSSVKFTAVPSANISEDIFANSRQYAHEDSEFVKMLKYLKRRVTKFVTEQGLSLELPDEVQVITEPATSTGRIKKEKKMIILPVLILLKLCKLKIMTSFILVGMVAIKKMLLTAAFILPGVVAAIKNHCKSQQYHVVPYQVDEEHEDDSGYAFSGYGSDKHYWDKRKRFSYF